MHGPNKAETDNDCREFLREFQGVLSWKWDSRFETHLAEFRADSEDGIRSILERRLSFVWDSSNIGKAPDSVRTIKSQLGGLKSGQMLFTSDPNRDAFIYCAWWPWGDGKTISIRVGPSCKKIPDSEKPGLIKRVKGWLRALHPDTK